MRTTLLVLLILFTPTLASADGITTAHPNWQWTHDMPTAKANTARAVRFRAVRHVRHVRSNHHVARAARRAVRHVEKIVKQNPVTQGIVNGASWLEANLGKGAPDGVRFAWCGYAMRKEMISMGFPDPGPRYNLARAWCEVGAPAPTAAVGSIFVSRGHVSKVAAGGKCPRGTVHTISGNASGRRVTHMCEPLARAICFRWPGMVNAEMTPNRRHN